TVVAARARQREVCADERDLGLASAAAGGLLRRCRDNVSSAYHAAALDGQRDRIALRRRVALLLRIEIRELDRRDLGRRSDRLRGDLDRLRRPGVGGLARRGIRRHGELVLRKPAFAIEAAGRERVEALLALDRDVELDRFAELD